MLTLTLLSLFIEIAIYRVIQHKNLTVFYIFYKD